jgi:hypothetical protein
MIYIATANVTIIEVYIVVLEKQNQPFGIMNPILFKNKIIE